MRIKEEPFNKVEKIWNDLYSKMLTQTSQYMQYDFQRIYKKHLKIGKQRAGMKYRVYVVYDNNEPKCIIPLICKSNGKDYYLAGDLCSTGCLDFIYDPELSVNDMSEVLFLLRIIRGGILHINKMQKNSLVFQSILSFFPDVSYREQKCVKICFGEDYDNYIKKLSKSVRQNIRTAHNRLNREEKAESYEYYYGKNILNDKEFLKLYHKRANEKNSTNRNILIEKVSDTFNPITRALKEMDNAFTSVFRIDGTIAGVMQGFIGKDNRSVIIPHLAINSEYSVYSPGALLISETIRYLISDTSVRELDLSRGEEKYKYSMGGIEYSIISTNLSIEE